MIRKKFSVEERRKKRSGRNMRISRTLEMETLKKRSAKQHIWTEIAKKL